MTLFYLPLEPFHADSTTGIDRRFYQTGPRCRRLPVRVAASSLGRCGLRSQDQSQKPGFNFHDEERPRLARLPSTLQARFRGLAYAPGEQDSNVFEGSRIMRSRVIGHGKSRQP